MIAVTSTRLCAVRGAAGGALVCLPAAAPRWQLLLGANLFYAVLCPAALPVLPGSSSGLVVRAAHREKARVPCGACGRHCCRWPCSVSARCAGLAGHLANALGIGYFTLQLVSYLCDVRQGRILPEEKIRPPFVLCVVLSLHLAGPLQPL